MVGRVVLLREKKDEMTKVKCNAGKGEIALDTNQSKEMVQWQVSYRSAGVNRDMFNLG